MILSKSVPRGPYFISYVVTRSTYGKMSMKSAPRRNVHFSFDRLCPRFQWYVALHRVQTIATSVLLSGFAPIVGGEKDVLTRKYRLCPITSQFRSAPRAKFTRADHISIDLFDCSDVPVMLVISWLIAGYIYKRSFSGRPECRFLKLCGYSVIEGVDLRHGQ